MQHRVGLLHRKSGDSQERRIPGQPDLHIEAITARLARGERP